MWCTLFYLFNYVLLLLCQWTFYHSFWIFRAIPAHQTAYCAYTYIIYRASCFLALAATILRSVVVSKAKRKAMSDKAGFFVSLASFSQVIAFSMLSATSFTSVLSIYSSMSKTSLLPFSGSCRIWTYETLFTFASLAMKCNQPLCQASKWHSKAIQRQRMPFKSSCVFRKKQLHDNSFNA